MSDRFSEREFEFCFNTEFLRKHNSAILGIPRIPSQRLENILGYDVHYRLQSGGYTRSLFLQHKVSTCACNRRGKNFNVWNCYQGPYYRFHIEKITKTQQHNILVELAANGEDVYYCAPLFTGFANLQAHYMQNQVLDFSRFFPPGSMGNIIDSESHSVSYNPTGTIGYFHSNAKKLPETKNWNQLSRETTPKQVDVDYVASLLSNLNNSVETVLKEKPMIPKDVQQQGNIVTILYMLRRYCNLEWLILP